MADLRWHPAVEDVLAIHGDIVSEYADTDPGVRSEGDVAFATGYVAGRVGPPPGTVHERAFHLLRLLVATHPFVDANKRTALNTAAVFYASNGRRFDYDHEVRTVLKRLGTDEAGVDEDETLEYLRSHTGAGERAGASDPDRESVSRLAASDRDAHRAVYDALEEE